MDKKMNVRSKQVCVTGGAGFIGSSLVKKLLQDGHIVHATLRNLGDTYKVDLLKKLPGAETRLHLFEADIYNPDEFDIAIKGCEFVFHVATPLQHTTHNNSQYKDVTEAAIGGVRSIAESCIKSGTVKRLIYTASIVAASPLKQDGTGYKNVVDESCWTPLNLQFSYSNDHLKAYANSKTHSEKEILSFGNKECINGGVLEVVTLVCGLIGGDTILSYLPESTAILASTLLGITNHGSRLHCLRFLQALFGYKLPILHIDDTVEAHLFCMDQSSINGLYLCASNFVTAAEITEYFRQYYPQELVAKECEEKEMGIQWGSRKLNDMGFVYKYDMKKVLHDSVACAKKFGDLM